MRTEKELFKLMLEHKEEFDSGLCSWCGSLYIEDVITGGERSLLWDYIHKNRPSMFSSLSAFKNRRNGYYWNKGDITPRIKWINKQIKKL